MRAISATGNAGFTLLELLVVLAIMVMISVAWPLASARVFAAQRLRDESQQLAAAIRAAQMTARMSGQPQELRISDAGRAWRISSENRGLPGGLTLSIRGGSNEHFILYPDGGSTGQSLDIGFEERVATVRVSPVTGHLDLTP
jgi:general secretion pathway protein H